MLNWRLWNSMSNRKLSMRRNREPSITRTAASVQPRLLLVGLLVQLTRITEAVKKISLSWIQHGDTPVMIIGLLVSAWKTFFSVRCLFILTIKTSFRSSVCETTRTQTGISFMGRNDLSSGKRNDRIPVIRFNMLKHCPMSHRKLWDN